MEASLGWVYHELITRLTELYAIPADEGAEPAVEDVDVLQSTFRGFDYDSSVAAGRRFTRGETIFNANAHFSGSDSSASPSDGSSG